MRDDKWLFAKLDEVWDAHFPDIPQDNNVRIVWGRKARSRLGSIKQAVNSKQLTVNRKHPETIITINSLFKDLEIPEYVVTGTIAHELSHYAHGFHSPLEKKYDTPHAGGVVRHEMRRRGLEKIQKAQKKWLKDNWKDYVGVHLPRKTQTRRRRGVVVRWI